MSLSSAIPSNYILKYHHLCNFLCCRLLLLVRLVITDKTCFHIHLKNMFNDMPKLLLLEVNLAVFPPL